MDVLKDVKNAETEAERIEEQYRSRAAELTARCAADLDSERKRRVGAVEEELRQYRDDLRRDLAAERTRVHEQGVRELTQLERRASANSEAAVTALLDKLNSR
jgi:F0F1-type ATP synthase membrane subunit b/b'